jgi:hypothetical protein
MKYSKFVVSPWHCEPETWRLDAPKSRHWHIVAEPHGGAGYGAGAGSVQISLLASRYSTCHFNIAKNAVSVLNVLYTVHL